MLRDLVLLLCAVSTITAQEPKWSWSAGQRQPGASPNGVDGERRRDSSGRFSNLEDFRDRYELAEQTTTRPNKFNDDGNGYGFNGGNNGQRYNVNGFGGAVPNALGGGPGGAYGGGIGPGGISPGGIGQGIYGPGVNGFRPNYQGGAVPGGYGGGYLGAGGFNGNFPGAYQGAGGSFYPGAGVYPGGYPGGLYQGGGGLAGIGAGRPFGPANNPLGNNAYNGVLVGPGGPTGIVGRPPYGGFTGSPLGAGPYDRPYAGGPGGFAGGSLGPGIGGAYGPGGLPYNGKSGSDILADEPDNNTNKAQKKSS